MKTNKFTTRLPFALIVMLIIIFGCKKDVVTSTTTNPIVIPIQTTVQTAVSLLGTSDFVVLAGSSITNTGATIINGDLGLSPGTAVGGFPPGILNGTSHINDAKANQAKLDLTTAYNDAAGRSCTDIVTLSGNIGGLTLTPGLYKSTSSLAITSGDLTLDAKGNANAIFIIQIASSLTTTSDRKVILSGGALSSNIFWQVGSSATFGTTSVFKGNILGLQSITFNTGATLEGRALCKTGSVTMAGNTIVKP
ncbi:MAG: ice-binding family protein [Bacteroidales bacterium]